MDNDIKREEKLFRKVINNPSHWKSSTGRPSSAIFKDSKGCSVDRDGNRSNSEVVDNFKLRFDENSFRAIVSIDASFCLDIGTHLLYKPEEDNIYHAEIHQSPEKIELTQGLARKLVSHCTVIYDKNAFL